MPKEADNTRLWTFLAFFLLGIWLLAAPATFGFRSFPLTLSNWVCGILLMNIGWIGRRNPKALWVWMAAAIGIWLEFTPLLFWAQRSFGLKDELLCESLVFFNPAQVTLHSFNRWE